MKKETTNKQTINKQKRASHFKSGLLGDAAEIPVRKQGEEIS